MEPTISVIMPIYNAEDRMSVSIDSVLSQSFEDFELILVNDGSTDRSAVICDNYAELDNRIVVLHQENKGVSAARNQGINQARGKYINFVDADDTIEPYTYELLIEYAHESDYDLIIFGMHFDYYKEDTLSNTKVEKIHSNIVLTGESVGKEFINLYRNNYLTPVWNKLFKSSIIQDNQIEFNFEMAILEDLNFTLDILDNVDKALAITEPLYHYYNEVLVSSFNRRPHIDYMKNFEILDDRLRKTAETLELKSRKYLDEFNNIIIRNYIIYLEYVFYTEVSLRERYKKTKEFINDKKVIKASQNAKHKQKNLILINALIKNKMKISLFVLMTVYNVIKNYRREGRRRQSNT